MIASKIGRTAILIQAAILLLLLLGAALVSSASFRGGIASFRGSGDAPIAQSPHRTLDDHQLVLVDGDGPVLAECEGGCGDDDDCQVCVLTPPGFSYN